MSLAWTMGRHTLAWVILAGFALAYLSGLYLFYFSGNGVNTAALTANGVAPADHIASTQPGEALSIADAEAMRSEIAVLRRQIEDMQRREGELRDRLATVEAAFGPNTASLPPQRDEARLSGNADTPRRGARPSLPVTVSYSPLPEDGFGDTMIERSPLPVAGVRQPTRTLFGVELASGETPASVRKKWAMLGARHKALLGGLQARHRDNEDDHNGAADVKLIAGPFPNAAEAAQLCARLRAAGSPCKETVFAGETF